MRWFEDLERAIRLYEELKETQEDERDNRIELGASERLLKAIKMELESLQEEGDGGV